jgi:hypothetical protein
MTRTQDEILARYTAADDFLGFGQEVLATAMTGDTMRQINPELTAEDVADAPETKPERMADEARGYLRFAVGKILDHRGISAERSTIKLREFAWLLGRDDVVQAMDAAEYPQYGAPKVKAFANGMGWPFFDDSGAREQVELERMSEGQPCRPDCESGCGQ